MSLRKINGVYLADTARVLGEVELGPDVNIWHGAVIRGDVASVTIGTATNVQDNVVIHCELKRPNIIGANVTVAHGVVLHGDEVGDGSLIGMNATVLGYTKIGKGCLIAAGAVLTPGTVVPDHFVVMGVPGKIVRETTEEEKQYLRSNTQQYMKMAQLYCQSPQDARFKRWNDQW